MQRFRTRQFLYVFIVFVLIGVGLVFTCRLSARPSQPSAPPQRIETGGIPYTLLLKGRWLVWTLAHAEKEAPNIYDFQFVVYDLDNARIIDLTNDRGRAVWLDGKNLYIARCEEEPTRNVPWPTENLYVVDLDNGKETLLKRSLKPGTLVNPNQIAWTTAEPQVCEQVTDCVQAYEYGCGIGIRKYGLITGEEELLGVLSRNTFLAGFTPSLIALSERFGSCNIKAYSGPIEVIDLDTHEYRVIAPGSVSPGPDVYVIDVVDRTVAYGIGPGHTRVLHIEPHGPVKELVDAEGVSGLGLAGPNILLYRRKVDGFYGLTSGLFAFDMQTGEHQQLVTKGDIRYVAGDERHVAWVDESGLLNVASLHLEPSIRPTVFDSPLPTLPAYFQLPLPMPTMPSPILTPTPAN